MLGRLLPRYAYVGARQQPFPTRGTTVRTEPNFGATCMAVSVRARAWRSLRPPFSTCRTAPAAAEAMREGTAAAAGMVVSVRAPVRAWRSLRPPFSTCRTAPAAAEAMREGTAAAAGMVVSVRAPAEDVDWAGPWQMPRTRFCTLATHAVCHLCAPRAPYSQPNSAESYKLAGRIGA
jgi:hypothetical protein